MYLKAINATLAAWVVGLFADANIRLGDPQGFLCLRGLLPVLAMGQEVDRYGRNDALGTKRALDPSCYVKRGQRSAYPVSLRPDGSGPA